MNCSFFLVVRCSHLSFHCSKEGYKDQLGNLRLSFRELRPAVTITATMEAIFIMIDEANRHLAIRVSSSNVSNGSSDANKVPPDGKHSSFNVSNGSSDANPGLVASSNNSPISIKVLAKHRQTAF